ncbi:HAD family hydrolase [Hamadaea sp. NPDC051192]|uniref:HAD family hydrolase n=1 Tax=Hamadaea sp. NPDC051192 TaxID=3154940 RepID=UPI00343D49BA
MRNRDLQLTDAVGPWRMRAIVFDYYGTLSNPAGESERRALYSRTGEVLGIDGEVFWAAMVDTFRERIVGAYGDTRSTLSAIAGRCGVTPSEDVLAEAVRVQVAGARHTQRPRPDAVKTLTALRERGFRLALMSDCSSELVEDWPNNPFAPLIDAPVFSWRERVRKPDPSLYEAAATRLGVSAADCWYVGDGGGRELRGAHDAGMRPVLVTNAAHPEAAQHRADPDEHVPDHSVDDLPDLLDLVGWAA